MNVAPIAARPGPREVLNVRKQRLSKDCRDPSWRAGQPSTHAVGDVADNDAVDRAADHAAGYAAGDGFENDADNNYPENVLLLTMTQIGNVADVDDHGAKEDGDVLNDDQTN